ncbi:hypothetical protein ILUMI_15233 [Ignelater luminosus]|uniref:Retrovirus-related Pol polyprotein from transposon TNT 1-94-like beta-barrel domain-containing protein n=1 Tax=Ignelater luminosus TaxID=2038154 RepID=A0A8K0G427_IGNLU|nr:hypothetical protein ILUMI_15233 [Ignelater luminosus]
MAASNKFNINPFDGSNFHNWKFRMRRILDEYGVLSSIENEVDNKDANVTKNDKKAMSLIVQCVNDGQLEILMEKESSYSMWKALCNVYEKKGLAGQLGLRKKLLNLKMKENENLEDHIKTFEEILRQLRETGAVVSEDDIVCALLNSLPDSFSTIVTVLENLPEESLNVDVIKGKLRDEVERRLQPNSDKSGDKTSVAFTAKQKFNGNCNLCGKYGHKARYCYNRFGGREKSTIQNHYHNNQQYPRVENQNCLGRFVNYQRPNRSHSNYMEADNKDKVCFVSENKHDLEEDKEEHDLKFFVDSGCTDHLVKDDSYFSCHVPLKKSIKIAVTKNGGFINAIGVGDIKAVSYSAKKKTECEIKNVLHVSELRRNLLSVK